MLKHTLKFVVLGLSVALTVGCNDATGTDNAQSNPAVATSTQAPSSPNRLLEPAPATPNELSSPVRWYTVQQVERGKTLYTEHCAACHGAKAQGAFNWRKADAAGKMPPPPLNGTGHAWHHPLRALGYQIKFAMPGGAGVMPSFKDKLTDEQIIDSIAWFQSLWSDEIYNAWTNRQRPK